MRRVGVIFGGAVVVIGGTLVGLYVALYLQVWPAPVSAKADGPHEASITMQVVAQVGHGGNGLQAGWVSYYAQNPQGTWVHSTILKAPAHSLIHVTIEQFDSATGLRNPLWGEPRGTVGGTIAINGKVVNVVNPEKIAHTFAIPELGVSVPLEGVNEEASNQCSNAPCRLDEAHNTITFEIRTGRPGKFRWQCFVPCGAGTIFGFGGPMQSIGYMDGELEVS
ncbi:MAG: hypothetical protein ACYCU0_08645 [Solirubrobacteraceae bacterium]